MSVKLNSLWALDASRSAPPGDESLTARVDPILVRCKLWQNSWNRTSNFTFLAFTVFSPTGKRLLMANLFSIPGNKPDHGTVTIPAAYVALETGFTREDHL